MRIVPNTGNDRVVDILRPWLRDGNRVDLASGTLSIFAFGELARGLARLTGARLVVPPDGTELDLRYYTDHEMGRFPQRLKLDFFAGSGSTAQAVLEENVDDNGQRRFILVQLPEPLGGQSDGGGTASQFCDAIGKPHTIAEITKERLRRASEAIRREKPNVSSDLGFRVFKLDASNIRAWEPAPDDLEGSLLAGLDHIESGRTEQDILTELLLKLGLDLCVPIETRAVAGKSVHSVGAGTLMVCLDEHISLNDVEPLGEVMAEWRDALVPSGEQRLSSATAPLRTTLPRPTSRRYLNSAALGMSEVSRLGGPGDAG